MSYSQSGYSDFHSRIQGYGNTSYEGQDQTVQDRASAAGSRLAADVGATVSAFRDGSMYDSIKEQAGEAASIISQAASGVAEWFRPSTAPNGYSTPGNAYVNNNAPPVIPQQQQTYPGFGSEGPMPYGGVQPKRRPWGNTGAPAPTYSVPPAAPPVPAASATARGVSGALPKGQYEAQLVKQMTAPGGTRVKPSESAMRDFYRKVKNLDLDVVGKELAKALDEPDSTWQHRLRVLYVVDGLWAQGLEEPVAVVKEECGSTGLVELVADSHTRSKALPILAEWGVEVGSLTPSQPSKSEKAPAVPDSDLLDLDDRTERFVNRPPPANQAKTVPQAGGAVVTSGDLLDL
ncbi:hypothetical protein FOL47_007036 [Perkinsus chesapeaki]|uniref:Uncharacterized protein n=1 Tax=Perkinsus chesapeaki TaxID=330153 RepID=A0A7J6LNC0_PERCH|nr:hypothetical protein FOL47_007036 [Perkinsus chesapeaki]